VAAVAVSTTSASGVHGKAAGQKPAAVWWLLIGLIPIVGWIVLIVFFVQDSHPANEYGPNPKGVGEGADYSQTPPPPPPPQRY